MTGNHDAARTAEFKACGSRTNGMPTFPIADTKLQSRSQLGRFIRDNFRKADVIDLERIFSSDALDEITAIVEAASEGASIPSKAHLNYPILRQQVLRSREIIIVLNDQIGDTILSTPLVTVLSRFCDMHCTQTWIRVVTKHPDLLSGLPLSFPRVRIEAIDRLGVASINSQPLHVPEAAGGRATGPVTVINLHREFQSYDRFVDDREVEDALVLSLDWRVLPDFRPWNSKSHVGYSLPYRLVRTIETLLGQKLLNTSRTGITLGPISRFTTGLLHQQHSWIPGNAILLSGPSSQKSKQYAPDCWSILIESLHRSLPNATVLFVLDQSPADDYEQMILSLQRSGLPVVTVRDSLANIGSLLTSCRVSVTPDTGIGHLSGAVGTPNVSLMFAGNPMFWRGDNTFPVIHPNAARLYESNLGLDERAWDSQNADYRFPDNISGKHIGASDLDPGEVESAVREVLAKYAT